MKKIIALSMMILCMNNAFGMDEALQSFADSLNALATAITSAPIVLHGMPPEKLEVRNDIVVFADVEAMNKAIGKAQGVDVSFLANPVRTLLHEIEMDIPYLQTNIMAFKPYHGFVDNGFRLKEDYYERFKPEEVKIGIMLLAPCHGFSVARLDNKDLINAYRVPQHLMFVFLIDEALCSWLPVNEAFKEDRRKKLNEVLSDNFQKEDKELDKNPKYIKDHGKLEGKEYSIYFLPYDFKENIFLEKIGGLESDKALFLADVQKSLGKK